MTLKSITFVQNHKVIEHFYYNNAHLNNIFHFARNSSLRKHISCVKIKGAIIIHVKSSGAEKLKILRFLDHYMSKYCPVLKIGIFNI